MKKIALHWQILIAMGAGIAAGILLSAAGMNGFSSDWIKPFGTIFINLLKLIAVPLVLVSLIKGVTSISDVSELSSMGGKTLGLYTFTTVVAVSIGLLIVNVTAPGKQFSPEMREEFKEKFATTTSQRVEQAKQVGSQSPLAPLVAIFPENIFSALSDNRNMLQVIFFALLFGVAIVTLSHEVTAPVKAFFDSLNEIVTNMVVIMMKFAPFGVFSLITSLISDIAGDDYTKALSLLYTLAYYTLTVLFGLALMVFVVYPILLRFFVKIPYKVFLKGILPAQMMAFSTSSSAATLPVTMRCMEEHFKVSKKTISFVMPLGATVNMDGTSLYQGVAAVFIAQVYGIDLSFYQQLGIITTTTLASIGAAAVPGAGLVMLVIVLEQAGIPIEGITLIFAPDRLLDMFRTVVNVTGDSAVCLMIEKKDDTK